MQEKQACLQRQEGELGAGRRHREPINWLVRSLIAEAEPTLGHGHVRLELHRPLGYDIFRF
jgi:hypothetical protein